MCNHGEKALRGLIWSTTAVPVPKNASEPETVMAIEYPTDEFQRTNLQMIGMDTNSQ
jgi:hypothetical protein